MLYLNEDGLAHGLLRTSSVQMHTTGMMIYSPYTLLLTVLALERDHACCIVLRWHFWRTFATCAG